MSLGAVHLYSTELVQYKRPYYGSILSTAAAIVEIRPHWLFSVAFTSVLLSALYHRFVSNSRNAGFVADMIASSLCVWFSDQIYLNTKTSLNHLSMSQLSPENQFKMWIVSFSGFISLEYGKLNAKCFLCLYYF